MGTVQVITAKSEKLNLRILHLVHQYSPHFVGGTELYTQTIATQQQERGHTTAVFAPTPAPPTNQPYHLTLENRVHIYRIPLGQRSRTAVFRHTFHQPQLTHALTAVLNHFQPQLIHIQHLMGLPLTLPRHFAHLPYHLTLHDYWYLCANGQLITNDTHQTCPGPQPNFHNCGRCALARASNPQLNPLAPLIAPLFRYRNRRLFDVLQRAQTVIAPTYFVQQTYLAQGAPSHNLRLLRHGIDIPHEHLAQLRQTHPYQPHTPLRLGFVGSIAPQKGVHLLIEAINQLSHDAVQLTIFGGLDQFPDYVASLKQTATHPHIAFAGRVSRSQLWHELTQLDLLIMPTLWYEASPLTIDEAFAAGLPIIAAQIGAMSEKIRDGIDGRLFPPHNAAALRDLLRELIYQPQQLIAFHQAINPVRTTQQHLDELDQIYHHGRISTPHPT